MQNYGIMGTVLQPAPKMARKMRYPTIQTYVRTIPHVIQPFMIHPVLPGETMKNMNFQARVVTDPINNPLTGWWTEFMWFYVKLSDLYERDDVREMLLNPSFDLAAFVTASGNATDTPPRFFQAGSGQVDWLRLAMRVIIDHYFRDEGDTYSTSGTTIDDSGETAPILNNTSSAIAKRVGNDVLDSVELSDNQESTTTDPVIASINEAGSATHVINASDVQNAFTQWQMQRLYNLTEMSWEDYLAAQGMGSPEAVLHRPELLRHVREWQYPTNTIDPTSGVPRSAVSWSIREAANKARMFMEPGFIVGVWVTRPKLYLSNNKGSFTAAMTDYKAWLPSFLHQMDANSTMKELAHDTGPLQDIVTDTDGYWVDIKDLLVHGEPFYAPGVTVSSAGGWTPNVAALPNAALTNKDYPALSDIKSWFVLGTGKEGKFGVTMDGIVNLAIASSPMNPILDTSPRGGRGQGETSGGF